MPTSPDKPSQGDTDAARHPPSETEGTASTQDSAAGRRIAFNAGSYHIFAFDLRQPVEILIERLCNDTSDGPGLDPTLPTLFLAECVLVYMPSDQTAQLLRGLARGFPHAAFLHYEQAGLSACQSLADQEKRFIETGWKRATAWTVNQVYQSFSQATRHRIEHVEMLDDLEISQQLFDHYCILYAVNDENQYSWSDLYEPLAQIC
ncbi:unnamed protein product [Echinostoma caproni]|uniref:[phosphatase 2A protein]-leucine-carboxy methyltransferase n=1 Tax=Echinostoma caproni TaxID=27848 RepID=A0A183B1R4_9TREM|nr:unnamed protein product [Echinostoma caproni]